MKIFNNKDNVMRKGAKARLSAGIALAAVLLSCLILAFTGIFGGFAKAMTVTNQHNLTVWGDIYNKNANAFNSTSLMQLLSQSSGIDLDELGTDPTAAVGKIKDKLDNTNPTAALGKNAISSAKMRGFTTGKKAADTDVIVRLNDLHWTATYLSEDKSGNPILTLWLAYESERAQFDAFATDTNTVNTTGNISGTYGNSYVRSFLNGTSYATSTSAMSNATQSATAQNGYWKDFINTFSTYLKKPSDVAWQQVQGMAMLKSNGSYGSWAPVDSYVRFDYIFPSECYGTPTSGTWNTGYNMHYFAKQANYNAWKNDYLWLPSLCEVGYANVDTDRTHVGLWDTSVNQRQNNVGVWTRSGRCDVSSCAMYLRPNGEYLTKVNNAYNNSYGVRPAIHLNLNAVAANCTAIAGDLYNQDTKDLDGGELSSLYSQIAGKQGATLNDVKSLLTADNGYQYSASDIRTGNAVTDGNDIYVYFGGLRWTVTYVSKSKTGNVVATLWLESSYINGVNQTCQYSTWNTANANWNNTYISSIYGTSLLRSYLNGTPYYSDGSGTINIAGSPNAYWQTFRDTYGKFIIEPLYMGWQETESSAAIDGIPAASAYSYINDAWGQPLVEGWNQSSTGTNKPATEKFLYSAWATDKLWSPSLTEVGSSVINSNKSLWNLTESQRQNGSSTATTSSAYTTWLRTSHPGNSYMMMTMQGAGNGHGGVNTNVTYAVRPAIHLNISGDETDLRDEQTMLENKVPLNALISNLTSATSNKVSVSSAYKDLDEWLSKTGDGVMSAGDIRANNGGSNINVKFGGMRWDLTYLSKTRSGEIIATLWLDNSDDLTYWSAFSNASTSIKYPSNMYSTSHIRAYLSGTEYTTDGNTLVSGKGEQSAKWKEFINKYSGYIATPAEVAWQETQSAAALGTYNSNTNNAANDAYGYPSAGGWVNTAFDYIRANPKERYSDWKNDYLWLPSFVEAGYGVNESNEKTIWQSSRAQRSNGTRVSADTWLRTSSSATSFGAFNPSGNSTGLTAGTSSSATSFGAFNPSGNSTGLTAGTSTVAAVRPAFHLKLSKIMELVSPQISDSAATEDGNNNKLTYNGKEQEVVFNVIPDLSRVNYTVQFETFTNATEVYFPATLSDGGMKMEGGKLYATHSGKYTITFNLMDAATTIGSSNYEIAKGENGLYDGDVWVSIEDDIKTRPNERVSEIVIYFEILPIQLEVEWAGDLNPVYNGGSHAVTATAKGDIPEGETVALDLTYSCGSAPVNAGEYVATAKLENPDYVLKLKDADGFDTTGYAATHSVKVEKAQIQAVWTPETQFTYSGLAQGAEIAEITGLCDDETTNAALLAALQAAVYYSDSPLHVGSYVAYADLDGLAEFANYELATAEFAFEIKPAEVTATYANADGTTDFERQFNGLKLEVTAGGFTLKESDVAEDIFVVKYRLATAADVPENWSETAPVFGEYVAKAFDVAHGDYTVTNTQTINITQREIGLVWSGDEKSVLTDFNGYEYISWLYDGETHAPAATVNADDLDGVYFLDGVTPVTDLKLDVTAAGQAGASVSTLKTKVKLSADEFNKYFTLSGAGTGGNVTCDYRIIKLEISAVEWYPCGGYGGAALADGAAFQKIEVYGATGPELEAYGTGTLTDKDGTVVTSVIKLAVSYNADFTDEYWTVGDYAATASVAAGSTNAAFAVDADKALDFEVTEQRIAVEEITVVWGLMAGGVFTPITDVPVLPFTGSAPALAAKDGEGNALPVNAQSLVADAGRHTAYIDLRDSDRVVYRNFECEYEISPLKVKLVWAKNTDPELAGRYEWFYTGSAAPLTATIDGGYLPDGFTADEYADILAAIATKGLSTVTVTSATDAGAHVATAAMSKNFEIVDGGSLEFTILKYRLNISDVVWWSKSVNGAGVDDDSLKYDADMKKYFTWANDGALHAPYAEVTVNLGGENVKIALTVAGATGATGTHYATALPDSAVPLNNNFIMGSFDGGDFTPCGAECKFIIVQFEVDDVYWTTSTADGADVSLNAENVLHFTYNGLEQSPKAYYLDGGEKVWLTVLGAMTDAGEYIAYVSENYAFKNDGSDKCEFAIDKKPLEVVWQYDESSGDKFTYNGTAQAPAVKLYDGEGRQVTALSEGDGYEILKFTEAGEHVAEIKFTNGNYTCKVVDGVSTGECAFTIEKYQIAVTFTPNADSNYVWTYNAAEQGPTVRNTTVYLTEGSAGIAFGESSEHRIIVTGRETDVGVYTVRAVLDGSVADNSNYELLSAEKEYGIAAYKITIIWSDGGSDGDYAWTYSGENICPTATYRDWTGITKDATVTGGNSSAGNYTASVVLPANCEFAYSAGLYAGTHDFTIKRAAVTEIEWFTDDTYSVKIEGASATYTFDGEMHLPAAKIKDTGAELIVTGARRNAGTGYIATAALSDSGNYVLDDSANKTMRFNVDPMDVLVKWEGNADAASVDEEFVWTYSGDFICPVAYLAFENEDGELQQVTEDGSPVYITVSGGAIAAGNEYMAVAKDELANYNFATARQSFVIEPKVLTGFTWNGAGATVDDSEVAGGGYVKYTYTYNGKTQRPLATLGSATAGVKFGYETHSYDGGSIGGGSETVNKGVYLVTVHPIDGNYSLPEGKDTVKVEILSRTVEVKWSAAGMTEAPTAWFFDADNQAVKLDVIVISDGTPNGFTASVAPVNGNYFFSGDMSKSFTAVVTSSGDMKWDFDENKWIAIPPAPSEPTEPEPTEP